MALLNMVFVYFAISDIYLIPHKICHFKTVDFFREAATSKQRTLGPVNGMLAEVEAQPKFRRPGEGRGGGYLSCFSLWKNHDKRNGERARACPTLLGFEPRIGPRHSCFEEIKQGSEWFADLKKKKKGNKGEVHRLKYSGNLRTTWENYFRATWEWELPVESQSHESCACANISMYFKACVSRSNTWCEAIQ